MDMEKVVKGLRDAEISLRGFANHFPPLRDECHEQADACYDAIELLQSKPDIVRCKDCRHRNTMHCFIPPFLCEKDDFFCANGERMEGR